MPEPPPDQLFELDAAAHQPPALYRAPDEPSPFGPITFVYRDQLGWVTFFRPDDTQPDRESTVTITLSPVGANEIVRYTAGASLVETGVVPDDRKIQALIIEAAERYARRVVRGRRPGFPDEEGDEDEKLTYTGDQDTRGPLERQRAQDLRGFSVFAGRLGVILSMVEDGHLRADHAADAILRHAIRLIQQYR